MVAAKGWSQAASIVLLLAAGRTLSVEEFGLFALASALTMVLNQWVGVGAYEYVIREVDRRDAGSTAFWLNTAVGGVLAVVGVIAGLASARAFGAPRLQGLVLLLVPLTLPAGWRSAMEAVLVKEGRLQAAGMAGIVADALGLAAALYGLLSGWGIMALVANKAVLFLSGPVLFALFGRWLPRLRFNRADAVGIGRLAASLYPDRLLGYIQAYGPDLVLGALLNPAAVALYRMGARTVVTFTSIVSESIRVLGWRQLASTRMKTGGLAEETERLVGVAALVSIGPLVGLAILGGDALSLVLGDKWAASGPVVAYLALAAVFFLAGGVSEPALGVVGAARWLGVIRAVNVAINVSFLLAFAHRGPAAAAASQLWAATTEFVLVSFWHRRLLGVRVLRYAAEVAAPAAAAGGMAITIYLVRAQAGQLPPLVRLALEATVGALVYGSVVLTFLRPRLRDAASFFHRAPVIAAAE